MGDWLVMAAELTLLRSRLLVPVDPADAQAARDDAERLRQTLLGRAETARTADWLEGALNSAGKCSDRGRTDADGASRRARTGDITALMRACLAALRVPADVGALYRAPGPSFWSVLDAVGRLREMLPAVEGAGRPLAGFLPPIPQDAPDRERRCRTAVSATFLAALELTREGAAELAQDEVWTSIKVRRPVAATWNQS